MKVNARSQRVCQCIWEIRDFFFLREVWDCLLPDFVSTVKVKGMSLTCQCSLFFFQSKLFMLLAVLIIGKLNQILRCLV